MKIDRLYDYVMSIPKSIYFCLKMFPIKVALRLPVIVSRNVWLENLDGKVELPDNPKFAGIRIGFQRIGIFDYPRARTIIEVMDGGTMVFRGKASFGQGTRISIERDARLILGNNVCITAESAILCSHSIEIDDDTLISWGCQFMDTDFHTIVQYNDDLQIPSVLNYDKPIYIGKKCWICSRCLILKGSYLKDDCILGGGSTLVPVNHRENTLLVGVPAKPVRTDISWSRNRPGHE